MTKPWSAPSQTDVIEILVRNRERFLGFLAARMGSRDAAEDLLQASLAKGVESAAAIRDEESVVAWFYRVLRNGVIDHYRHRAVEARALETLAREGVAPSATFEDELLKSVCECVSGLLPTLKPEYAEVLRRIDVEDASLGEAARALEITPNNAGVRLHRARAALRQRLEQTCGACAEHHCLDCRCARPRL